MSISVQVFSIIFMKKYHQHKFYLKTFQAFDLLDLFPLFNKLQINVSFLIKFPILFLIPTTYIKSIALYNILLIRNMLEENFDFDFGSAVPVGTSPAITIGYYKLRGKAQVPRLLCEYLKIEYKDELFTLAEWDRYKKTQTKNWDFRDVPFLKQGDFIVTEPTPICTYLINRFGSPDLLGKTLEDRAILKMYVWTIETMGNVININCQKKTPQELMQLKKNQWKNNVAPRLQKYEQIARQDDWFLGYFTLIDLSMYELVRYMDLIFPGEMAKFPKLFSIMEKVANIPQIKEYELSPRAVREIDPTTLLEELKKSKLSKASSTKS